MAFDPKVYRNSKDGIGNPQDEAATDSTSAWTIVSLLKWIGASLNTLAGSTVLKTDDGAFTIGTDKVQPTGGIYKSTRDSVDDGDTGALAMTAKRALYTTPETPDGDTLVDETNNLLKVQLIPSQNGVAGGAGAAGATVLRTVTASDSPEVATLGATSGAAVVTDATGTIQQYLRGLVKFCADALGAGTAAAAKRVVLATDTTVPNVTGNVASGATDSGNPVKVGAKYNATLPTLTDGQRGDLQVGTRGSLNVTLFDVNSATGLTAANASADGSTTAGTYLATVSRAYAFNGTTWDRTVKPNATSRIVSSAATTNATSAKASAGNLHKVIGYNAKTSVVYLKFYNKATAPTVGTDTPVLTLYLPGLTAFDLDFSSLYFSTGIGYGLTTDNADAGTTAVAAGDILGLNVVYS